MSLQPRLLDTFQMLRCSYKDEIGGCHEDEVDLSVSCDTGGRIGN